MLHPNKREAAAVAKKGAIEKHKSQAPDDEEDEATVGGTRSERATRATRVYESAVVFIYMPKNQK